MIDFSALVAILCRDNPARERGQMIWVADQLLTWYRASVDVRTYGATKDGKPNPSAKAARDAAAILWGKTYKQVIKDSAIEYLEENHGVTEQNDQATHGRERSQTGDVDPSDIHVGGVAPPVDSGTTVVRGDVGTIPRKGRKPGSSKLPAHLRA